MKINSIRFKVTTLYTAILGAVLIVYSAILILSLHYTLYNELDSELTIKVQEIRSTIDTYLNVLGRDHASFIFSVKRTITMEGQYPDPDKTEEIKEIELLWSKIIDKLDLKEDYINFLNPRGRSIVSSENLQPGTFPVFIVDTRALKAKKYFFKNLKYDNKDLRIINTIFSYQGEPYIIQVGTSLKPIIHILQNRFFYVTISIPLILFLTTFLGQIFASRILKPVVEVTKTARNITLEDLGARVKTKHVDEEMRYLVDAFNDMISRLEKSFKYIAEFSSHVSHELKTPLAIIKGESELAMHKERDIEEYKRVIRVNLEEAERMLKIIEDLLLLTRLDYRPHVFRFEQIDLIEFMREIYEQASILSNKKGITIDFATHQKPIRITGDSLHLRRLFLNLITNAIKFNIKDGAVNITVRREAKRAIVSIADTGVGIAEEDLPKIFDRFFHKDRIAQDSEPGNGLGLSIAQSIVRAHHGSIEVKSQVEKGSTFSVILPLL